METTILNYRIVISPDTKTGSKKPCFSAYCPTLGVADDGKTIEEAIAHIQMAIELYVQSLTEDNLPIPVDHLSQIITTTQVSITHPLAFA